MLTLSRLVKPRLSKLRWYVCNVMAKRDQEAEKAKPSNDAKQIKKMEIDPKEAKEVCGREGIDGKTTENIMQQVHQKWLQSTTTAMIQDLQPMNMPHFGMKHNAICPEIKHAFVKVSSSLSRARLEGNSGR